MLKLSDNKNSVIHQRLLKASFSYFSKKLLLATIFVITLLILAHVTQISHTETNIEPAASLRYATPKYTSVIYAVTSGIMPRAPMSQNQMEDVRQELDRRRQWVTRVCQTIDTKRSHPDATLKNMIIDTEYNISWCPIYKAASSTWMNYFAVLKGTSTDAIIDLVRRDLIQISDIVKQKYQQNMDFNKSYEKIGKTKKFLIVRHPLERLLSAYRDKLEHMQNREYYYKRFGRRIVLKYRQPGNATTKLEPTFAEFLRFIVDEKHFDEHWIPYYRTCEPCIIHYDYILKFETLERDQNFLIQETNLSEYLHEKNYSQNINPMGITNKKILHEYIQGISQSLLDEVNKIYENDYKLFNYSTYI